MNYLLRRCSHLKKILHKNASFSSTLNFCTEAGFEPYKTHVSHPGEHTLSDAGLYYTIENDLFLNVLFKGTTALHKRFIEECKTFGETAILIRKPALEIINCLKNTDYKRPVNKYVLYGKYGNGVSTTMFHCIHYAHLSGWLVFHVPNISVFSISKTEVCDSATMEGYKDVPIVASEWLTHFKRQNLDILSKLDLRLNNDYKWNIKEENKKGESLLSLIDHGISRGVYSCAVVNALVEEVKLFSSMGIVRTLVAIDRFADLFQLPRKYSNRKRKVTPLDKISCVTGFKKLVIPDWHNGAVILACSSTLGERVLTEHLPMNQLTREGFELLDPFVPIEVPYLSKKEMISVLSYYKSKKWLLNSEADEQLQFLSAGNALTLRDLCGAI